MEINRLVDVSSNNSIAATFMVAATFPSALVSMFMQVLVLKLSMS